MEKLKEAKRNIDKAYVKLDQVVDEITRLHELLLKQLVEEVTKNGLRLTHEQCVELELPIWGTDDIKCCKNKILVACEYEKWDPFRLTNTEKMFLCVSCGKRFARRRQVCPNCGKDVEPVERWQEIQDSLQRRKKAVKSTEEPMQPKKNSKVN